MKKIIKALAILLSCATIASVGGLMACDNEDFEYILSDDGTYYSVSNYTGNDESVTIPTEYNGLPVTEIVNSTFKNNEKIISVTIPDSVTYIGSGAFYSCSALQSVTIPDSVTYIEEGAFEECSVLQSVTIGKGVTLIADYVFCECISLTTITIPDSVIEIDVSSFYYCSSLTSIIIPDSVTYIGSSAFYGCTSLTSVSFVDTEGWYVSISKNATSGTDLLSSDLSDASTAATYLTSTHYQYCWYKANT